MKALIHRALIVASFALCAPLCRADDGSMAQPPNEIRVGMYAVFYHVTAQDLQGPYVIPGLNASLKNLQTPYFAYERYLPWNLNFELNLGVPPLTKTYGKGPATVGSVPYNGQELITARWFAPSALLYYTFFDAQRFPLRPYVGVGLTYVNFYDRQTTAAGNAVSGGPTSVSLPSSIGPTVSAGLSYKIARNWGVYASYSMARVRTLLTTDTDGVYRTAHISFAPGALVISAGYSF
jgi:outer membrane protein